MITRVKLQEILENILGSDHVYFQAPPNTGMKYPAIVYSFEKYNRDNADNQPYILTGRWQVTHMYKSIGNDLKERMLFEIPHSACSFDRRIKSEGIYNDYYTINL